MAAPSVKRRRILKRKQLSVAAVETPVKEVAAEVEEVETPIIEVVLEEKTKNGLKELKTATKPVKEEVPQKVSEKPVKVSTRRPPVRKTRKTK